MRRIALFLAAVIERLLNACWAGLRLALAACRAVQWGLLRQEEISARVRKHWQHDPLMEDDGYILKGLLPWEERVYAPPYLTPQGRLAVLACGSGRDLIGLARKGYRVEGVELVPKLAAAARRYAATACVDTPVHCADMAEFKFPNGPYDAFVFSFLSYGYVAGSARRIELLRKLRTELAPGGCVLLSCLSSQAAFDTGTRRVADAIARITGNPHPPETGDRLQGDYFDHIFTKETLRQEARQAGLTLQEIAEPFDTRYFAVPFEVRAVQLIPVNVEVQHEKQAAGVP